MTSKIGSDAQEWFALMHDEVNVEEITWKTTTPDGVDIVIRHVRGSDEVEISRD